MLPRCLIPSLLLPIGLCTLAGCPSSDPAPADAPAENAAETSETPPDPQPAGGSEPPVDDPAGEEPVVEEIGEQAASEGPLTIGSTAPALAGLEVVQEGLHGVPASLVSERIKGVAFIERDDPNMLLTLFNLAENQQRRGDGVHYVVVMEQDADEIETMLAQPMEESLASELRSLPGGFEKYPEGQPILVRQAVEALTIARDPDGKVADRYVGAIEVEGMPSPAFLVGSDGKIDVITPASSMMRMVGYIETGRFTREQTKERWDIEVKDRTLKKRYDEAMTAEDYQTAYELGQEIKTIHRPDTPPVWRIERDEPVLLVRLGRANEALESLPEEAKVMRGIPGSIELAEVAVEPAREGTISEAGLAKLAARNAWVQNVLQGVVDSGNGDANDPSAREQLVRLLTARADLAAAQDQTDEAAAHLKQAIDVANDKAKPALQMRLDELQAAAD